ncbi:MFS transporter [Paenibacillus lupini]|uniref:MFS transporter n=1 Tax=Paenibacillus lupini TaxID=1450204 RepID=UPI0031333C33|nr:MFS family permease [Paenibacillus lupini]
MNKIGMRLTWLGVEMRLISVILFIVEFVRGAVLISLLPIYGAKVLHLSLDIIGLAITAHYLTDTLLKLIFGYLLDRFSIRFVIRTGLFVSLIGVFLIPFATVPWLFIMAAALYGIGISPIWIVCLTKVSKDNRATQIGFLYTVWLVGLGSGPIVCNILLDYYLNKTYFLLLILSVIGAFLAFFISSKRSDEPSVQAVPLNRQLSTLVERIKAMRMILPGMIMQTAGASMLVPVLPSFAEKGLGLAGTQYSLLLTAGGVCAAAGLIPMGRLSDKLGGKHWFLIIGFAIFGIGLSLLASRLPFWYCLVIVVILGLSYAAILPAWNALLASFVPPNQEGLGWGLLATVEGIGGMVGPVAGGLIAASFSTSSVIWVSAALFGGIAFLYLIIPSSKLIGKSG